MIACRSPALFWPPSIGVVAVNGYGPLSLSDEYWNLTELSGVEPVTMVHGIPYGTFRLPDGP